MFFLPTSDHGTDNEELIDSGDSSDRENEKGGPTPATDKKGGREDSERGGRGNRINQVEEDEEEVDNRPMTELEWKPFHQLVRWRDANGQERIHVAILLPSGVSLNTRVSIKNGELLIVKAKWPSLLRNPFELHLSRSFEDLDEWIKDGLDHVHTMIQVKYAFRENMEGICSDSQRAVWSTAKFRLPIRVRDHPDKIRRIGGDRDERILYVQMSGYEEKNRYIVQDEDFIIG